MTKMPKEIVETQKANLETFKAVQNTLFEGFEKLVDLNMKVVKATMDELNEKTNETIAIKDPQEALSMSSALVQPTAEKAVAYSKHVYDIVSNVQTELAKLAETQLTQGQKQLQEAFEQAASNAPAGSESLMNVLKSMAAQTNAAYENVAKAAKQAAEATEKNIQAATSATLKAATDAAATGAAATTRAAGRRSES